MPMARTALLSLLLLGCLGSARAADLHLSCNATGDQDAAEARRIASLAPGVVKRIGAHELSVRTAAGPLRFVDEAPYGKDLSGTRHAFCDRRGGYVLLTLEDEDEFTGVLVDEATGKTSPGGMEVLFSHDRRSYLATEQPDGLDGERWKIYGADGSLTWSGYSYIPLENDEGEFAATLHMPAWNEAGEFTAIAQCIGNLDTQWPVKLTKVRDKWQWLPARRCEET